MPKETEVIVAIGIILTIFIALIVMFFVSFRRMNPDHKKKRSKK